MKHPITADVVVQQAGLCKRVKESQKALPMYLWPGLHRSTVEGRREWPNLKAAVMKLEDMDGSTFGSYPSK